jgi:Fe-S-cluster containining protein
MDNKGSEERALSSFCEKCGGRCCTGHHILLSGREFSRLKILRDFQHGRIDSTEGVAMASIDALGPGRCPFLEDRQEQGTKKTACILGGVSRPLVCRMFPLTYTCERGKIEFFLSKKCPYFDDVAELHEWISNTTFLSRKELESSWSGKERRALGSLRVRAGDELQPLPSCEQGY